MNLYGPLVGCSVARYSHSFGLTTLIKPGSSPSSDYLILLGGLSDALLPCPYTVPLADACTSNNVTFVNPLLRTSSLQFGFGSLDTDVSDLDELITYLTSLNEGASPNFILVGHSTGCQQSIHFLRTSQYASKISGVILQAPVSDRETDEDNAKWVELAEEMCASGKGDEFLPRAAFWAPITATRFRSLYALVADGDDYFSSDLSEAQMTSRLSHVSSLLSSPTASLSFCVAAYAMNDEYVPPSTDIDALLARFESFGMEIWKFPGLHNLKPTSTYPTSHTDFVSQVENKLKTLS
mmetsp:Transcript_13342/g.27235  ORF Transcript_13342/g.27235 Transcript_13342/m.27235 type:complete len:295 (+) Transcript_13342:97-981(+)